MSDQRFVVIANAEAGSADDEAIEATSRALGAGTAVVFTDGTDELDAAIADVGDRCLVVAGGDGSLHAVVSRLRAIGRLADTPLGLVPLGTGNDFAGGLGLPDDPAEAAARVRSGAPRRLDLLVDDDGGVVVNVAHAGLGAVAADVAADLKPRLGPLAYPLGAVVAAVKETGWSLTVDVDGTPLVEAGDRVLMVGVGNGSTIGGGTPLCPEAEPDDGLADVVVVTATGPAARVAFGAALRNGDHVDRDDVVCERGTVVRIAGEAVGHNADGEVTAPVSSRTYTLEPAAWSLVL